MITYRVLRNSNRSRSFSVEVSFDGGVIVPKARFDLSGKARAEFEAELTQRVRAEAARRLRVSLRDDSLWPIARSGQTKAEVSR